MQNLSRDFTLIRIDIRRLMTYSLLIIFYGCDSTSNTTCDLLSFGLSCSYKIVEEEINKSSNQKFQLLKFGSNHGNKNAITFREDGKLLCITETNEKYIKNGKYLCLFE